MNNSPGSAAKSLRSRSWSQFMLLFFFYLFFRGNIWLASFLFQSKNKILSNRTNAVDQIALKSLKRKKTKNKIRQNWCFSFEHFFSLSGKKTAFATFAGLQPLRNLVSRVIWKSFHYGIAYQLPQSCFESCFHYYKRLSHSGKMQTH